MTASSAARPARWIAEGIDLPMATSALNVLVRVMDHVLLDEDGAAWILLSRLHRELLVEMVAAGYEVRTAYERDVLS